MISQFKKTRNKLSDLSNNSHNLRLVRIKLCRNTWGQIRDICSNSNENTA